MNIKNMNFVKNNKIIIGIVVGVLLIAVGYFIVGSLLDSEGSSDNSTNLDYTINHDDFINTDVDELLDVYPEARVSDNEARSNGQFILDGQEYSVVISYNEDRSIDTLPVIFKDRECVNGKKPTIEEINGLLEFTNYPLLESGAYRFNNNTNIASLNKTGDWKAIDIGCPNGNFEITYSSTRQ